jgi:hypothetical protein
MRRRDRLSHAVDNELREGRNKKRWREDANRDDRTADLEERSHMPPEPQEESVLDAIRGFRRREPFTPFRIVMNGGESYTVENPELLAMNEHHLVYCVPHSGRVVYMRLHQISEVDDIGESLPRRRAAKKH